jgi:hypothetical protein
MMPTLDFDGKIVVAYRDRYQKVVIRSARYRSDNPVLRTACFALEINGHHRAVLFSQYAAAEWAESLITKMLRS